MNYTAVTYSNINPVVFYGGGFCFGVDPRREQYAGKDVAGVDVPNYKTKYEALQNVIKDNYQLFEVDYYGVDNDNYVDGAGFCCDDSQLKTRSVPTENVDYEKLQYYYHSDHLGSASYITNLDGEVVQHIEYVPFGEVFLEERNNTWNTPYLFNGKELDEETGLYYYGARYYNPRISLWYGVDPLAEKYPAHSPYCYTMNNPVMLIDPDGREVEITGSESKAAFKQLQESVKRELALSCDKGIVGYSLNSDEKLSSKAQMLVDAIDSKDIKVQVKAENTKFTESGNLYIGGAFMGNTVNKDGTVNAIQEVNPSVLGIMSETNFNPGGDMLHEVTEAYQGGW